MCVRVILFFCVSECVPKVIHQNRWHRVLIQRKKSNSQQNGREIGRFVCLPYSEASAPPSDNIVLLAWFGCVCLSEWLTPRKFRSADVCESACGQPLKGSNTRNSFCRWVIKERTIQLGCWRLRFCLFLFMLLLAKFCSASVGVETEPTIVAYS